LAARTANDPQDSDTGPNNLQNKPVLDSAITSGSSTTNANGNTGTFAFNPAQVVAVGDTVTATATQANSTSESSAPRTVAS
jgi:plastocyanin